MNVLQFPLARITLWFVLGILFSFYVKPDAVLLVSLFLLSLAICFMASYFPGKALGRRHWFGISLYFLSFISGSIAYISRQPTLDENHYIHHVGKAGQDHTVRLQLREKLKGNAHSERYFAIVKWIDSKRTRGKILVSFEKGSKHMIGKILYVNGTITRHRQPLNPGQFDYGKYLENKSVLAQLYPKQVKFNGQFEKDIWYYSDRIRQKIITNLQTGGFENEALQVLNALILGQQQDISPETLRDYQYAGAVHILSVSGLHVGFILLFLNFLLRPLPKNKSGRRLKFLLILACLWGFAIVAGLSPSVVRSATMFSFMAWGMCLRRSTNIFHTLLVSLLVILFFEPSFLFDVGFQLSYAAVFFILWLQPLFSGLWQPENRVVRYFWEILTVSFAAQIGAFPLSVYYFHQFPGLFFMTNLVVIPFLSLIMLLGVLVMALAAFNCVLYVPMKTLEWCIILMNKFINAIASFEKFIIQDIPFNFYMLAACYLMVVAWIVWFKKPGFQRLALAMSSLIIFQVSCFGSIWKAQKQQEWIVFNVGKNTLITETAGRRTIAYSTIPANRNFALKSYLTANFSRLEKSTILSNTFYCTRNKVLLIDSFAISPDRANPDILLLRQSPKFNLERFFLKHRPKVVVADASNFKTYVAVWKRTCTKEKIPFHFTGEKGFYRIKK